MKAAGRRENKILLNQNVSPGRSLAPKPSTLPPLSSSLKSATDLSGCLLSIMMLTTPSQ